MLYPGTGSKDGKQGDHILVSPSYTVSAHEIEAIVKGAKQAIDTVFARLNGPKL